MIQFKMTQKDIERDLSALVKIDKDFGRALDEIGFPEERKIEAGFKTFMGIVVGQQLSVKAAATIRARLLDKTEPELTPETYLKLNESDLRAIGLSRQKIRYGDGLARAVLGGEFDPNGLGHLSDDEVLKKITALLGFGRWSAEMYLMFSLGRPDIWPAGDLGVQEGLKRVKNLKKRPDQKEMDKRSKKWSPYRSSAALFLWHYLENAPVL